MEAGALLRAMDDLAKAISANPSAARHLHEQGDVDAAIAEAATPLDPPLCLALSDARLDRAIVRRGRLAAGRGCGAAPRTRIRCAPTSPG
jgi:hypothetical protein